MSAQDAKAEESVRSGGRARAPSDRGRRSALRVYLVVLGVALLAGVAYLAVDRLRPGVRDNVIKVIQPYRDKGTWVFDDAATGLKGEPFVNGIPEMIDRLVADIPDAASGFRLTFSGEVFPDHELHVERGERYGNGYYYVDPRTGEKGWLCPALFRYFRDAPDRIYVKADPLDRS
jgi:hypothetical protein